MPITTTQFAGHEALSIEAGAVRLVVSTSVGPRVLALLTADGANALAELPDMTLDCPGSDPIHLRGGHRLWAAPEDPRVTYRPDDDPVDRGRRSPEGVRLTTRPDPVAGTSRETSIVVTGSERLSFDYRVVNTADQSQRLAAWAITMMAPGGRAWLPFLAGEFDPGGFQAQRNIVLWTYAQDGRSTLHPQRRGHRGSRQRHRRARHHELLQGRHEPAPRLAGALAAGRAPRQAGRPR